LKILRHTTPQSKFLDGVGGSDDNDDDDDHDGLYDDDDDDDDNNNNNNNNLYACQGTIHKKTNLTYTGERRVFLSLNYKCFTVA
jgi:hypothetical protein